MTQWRCCHSELWGLLTIVVLQDVPFLTLRLYCLSRGIFGYSLLFYSVKNVLVVVLEAYRFTVLALRCMRPGFDERPSSVKSVTMVLGVNNQHSLSLGTWSVERAGRGSTTTSDEMLNRTDSTWLVNRAR